MKSDISNQSPSPLKINLEPFWRPKMDKEKTPVDEVRAIRHRIAEECGHDIRKIMEHAANAMRSMKIVATPSFG